MCSLIESHIQLCHTVQMFAFAASDWKTLSALSDWRILTLLKYTPREQSVKM